MRVWRVSSFSKIKPARPAALKHQAQTRQNRGGSAGLAGLAGLRVQNAFWTTNGSKFVKITTFYVLLFSTTFSFLTLNIAVLEPLQPSIGDLNR